MSSSKSRSSSEQSSDSSKNSRYSVKKHRKHKFKRNLNIYRHHHHKKHRKQKRSRSHSSRKKEDAGHFKYQIGMKVKGGQFKIVSFLGDGTFGRVLEVENQGKYYAMKCIRAVDRYIESAKIEAKILWHIQDRDKEGKQNIVRLHTTFERYGNYFMIFEKLGKSLYDIIKMNKFKGFSMKYVQGFSKQILESLAFIHSLNLTHTDLKPENILLVDEVKKIVHQNQQSDYYVENYVPTTLKIKLIDFGGATFSHEYHSTVINTRQYRAPEVILGGIKWSTSSDIWCLACVIIEIATGQLFFQNKDDLEHIAMIEKQCGPFPFWMVNRIQSKLRDHFYTDEKYFQQNKTCFKWPHSASSSDSIKRVKAQKLLSDLITSHVDGNPLLTDLLQKMLVIDPQQRITCQQALEHPFFKIRFN